MHHQSSGFNQSGVYMLMVRMPPGGGGPFPIKTTLACVSDLYYLSGNWEFGDSAL